MALSDRQDKDRPACLPPRLVAGLVRLVGGMLVVLGTASIAWAQTPLYERRPFDRITLDDANKNLVLDVLPLNKQFPDRKLPEKLPTTGKMVVEPINEPGTEYECFWRSVAKIELFEQLILNEVKDLVRQKRFDDAYQYFAQLENEKPDLPGLQEAIDEYLYEEAKAFHVAGQYDGALARLREISERNPQWPGLDRDLGAATEMLVDKEIKAKQYWVARSYLDNLAKQYPEHAVVTKWRGHLQQLAEQALQDARTDIENRRLREAHAAIREVAAIWPGLPGAEELRKKIASLYPRFVVGVESPATVCRPGSLHDWASRRSGRLVERMLLELAGPGMEGGKYVCPVGQMKVEDLGRQLKFDLRSDIAVGGGDDLLTGYDLSRQLLAMADPNSPQYFQLWCDLFESVSVHNVFTVVARLKRSFVLPQALLQTPIAIQAVTFGGEEGEVKAEAGAEATTGPYFMGESKDGETTYLTNNSYFAGGASRPKEIVERRFATGDDMIQALRRGDVDVVDRINLWELEKFRALGGVQVKRYAVPLVHCLIPNPKRPLSSRRTFRRALVYGINREAILGILVRSEKIPGCQIVSGPFSAGVTTDDPLDYAYDNSIEPRTYEPQLAVVLAQAAFNELVQAAKKKGEKVEAIPETVLAYPATATAKMAVGQIQQHLKVVGINVRLKELGPAVPDRIPEDVDLLYAELAMWEPIVDAERLLGEDGIMGEASPYMRQALMRLRQSVDWPTVGQQLRDIHQLAHSEVTIIPLWQLSDYFAHVTGLEGLGDAPVTLYQHVEEWQASSQIASKKQ